MAKNFEISSLIDYFAEKVQQIDNRSLDGAAGNTPQYPMMIILLGDDSINSFVRISQRLFQLWPQYTDEIGFLGVKRQDKSFQCFKLSQNSGSIMETKVEQDEVCGFVSSLFGTDKHFKDRNKLLIYYVINTSGFGSASDFADWMLFKKGFIGSLDMDTIDMLDMTVIYLNDTIGSARRIANDVRNKVLECLNDLNSTVLLSNRRNDNAILSDWICCDDIVASLIAVSNSQRTAVTSTVFSAGGFTAGYCREEKPTRVIGQVVVQQLIEYLSDNNLGEYEDVTQDSKINQKLGLSEDKSITIIDQYCDEYASKQLPTPEQLMLFPRKTTDAVYDIESLNERDFNEITMSSWECYLESLADRIMNEVKKNSDLQKSWRTEYSEIISSNFTINELLWLKEHIPFIENKLCGSEVVTGNMDVLSAAKLRLRLTLSSLLSDQFVKVIAECGDAAASFINAWKEIHDSLRTLHKIGDENLVSFYERKMRTFFDRNGNDLISNFKAVTNVDELIAFLKGAINSIIDSDPVFTARFETELASRLNADMRSAAAEEYISGKLSCVGVPLYYQANFNTGAPVASCVLLKTNTELYKSLERDFSNATYFYNTENGSSAESIYVYALSKENIMKG